MWKVTIVNVGEKLELLPPNENATVTVVPIEWLPNERQVAIYTLVSEASDKAQKLSDAGDFSGSINTNLAMMTSVLGDLIKRWTLKDPETGEDLPLNKDSIKLLPMPVISVIFEEVMGTSQAAERDQESGLPLEKPEQSENSSSVATIRPLSASGG